jgi:SAM-dependent methyltransferase
MFDTVRKETFRELVQRPIILSFAQEVITQSYVECAGERAVDMEALLHSIFQMLVENAADPDHFERAMASIHVDVLHKQDPEFWFNHIYKDYKRLLKPRYRFDKLQGWLSGSRVLDFGCGDGLLSNLLQEHGYQAAMCDVLDYRDAQAKGIPFKAMEHPGVIPYADGSFDTTLLMAVLHHVEVDDLLPLLTELRRVTRRLVVEEDSFDVPADMQDLPAVLSRDVHLRNFMGLAVADQLRYLMFIDTFANVIAQGLVEMDIPYNFKTVGAWLALFRSQGWQVTRTIPMGFQAKLFNRSCHIWYVLDRIG